MHMTNSCLTCTFFQMQPNFVAIQLTGIVPFTIDVALKSDSSSNEHNFIGDTYTKALDFHQNQFDQKFERIFELRKKG